LLPEAVAVVGLPENNLVVAVLAVFCMQHLNLFHLVLKQ
jgi:hypothetical protein